MKHYIIVKFNENVNVKGLVNLIKELFDQALKIEGIEKIDIYTSNSTLSNRYDLMIKMTLEKHALTEFDQSEIHATWKEKYQNMIMKKAIFDCELEQDDGM